MVSTNPANSQLRDTNPHVLTQESRNRQKVNRSFPTIRKIALQPNLNLT